jgi:excisionase family DNA binding protein
VSRKLNLHGDADFHNTGAPSRFASRLLAPILGGSVVSALSPEIENLIEQSVARAVARRLPSPRETYLTVKDVSTAMHVHADTVLRMIHAGTLRSVGAGKLLRIPQSALDEYFSINTPEGAVVK